MIIVNIEMSSTCDHCQKLFEANERFWRLPSDKCCSVECLNLINKARKPVEKPSVEIFRKVSNGGGAFAY